MSFFELSPYEPDEDHPAIVEHTIIESKDGITIGHKTKVISQWGHEAHTVDPRDALGVDPETNFTGIQRELGDLAVVGFRVYE